MASIGLRGSRGRDAGGPALRGFLRWAEADVGARATLVGCVYVAVFALWVVVPVGDERQRTVLSDIAPLPLVAACSLLAFRAARLAAPGSDEARGWRRIALAVACWFAGDAIWYWEEVVRRREPFPSLADIGYLGFTVLFLWGLLSFPGSPRKGFERRTFWLDVLTVALAASMLAWFTVVGPLVQTDDMGGMGGTAAVLNVVYPVCDAVLLLCAATLLLRGPVALARHTAVMMAISAAFFVAGDLGYARLSLSDSYQGGDWPDLMWMAAHLAMLAGSALSSPLYNQPDADRPNRIRAFGSVPYLAVGTGFFVLLTEASGEGTSRRLPEVVVGVLALAGLALGRQFVVTRENARLSEELHAVRERALQEANSSLRDEEAAKDAFLRTISHELQTPLASIVGFSNLLIDSRLEGPAGEYAGRVQRNAEVLRRLVDDLLDLGRLERDAYALVPETIPLGAFVAGVIRQVEAAFPSHRFRVAAEPAVNVSADPQAVTRIVTNLVANAVRFSPAGTTVDVSVLRLGRSGCLSVLDRGPGIPDGEQDRIFERFYRAGTPVANGRAGTGIGLAVVAELTSGMGGSVSVGRRSGGGAAFMVSLPLDLPD